jgi:hypothetical protein
LVEPGSGFLATTIKEAFMELDPMLHGKCG